MERKNLRRVNKSNVEQHGLEPLEPLRLKEIRSFDQLLEQMKETAVGARDIGNALNVLSSMVRDTDCNIVLTLSGVVTVAKLGGIIAEMIERDLISCIVSTGAVICHGLSDERGSKHYKLPKDYSDAWLFEQGYNRIFDTIETEYAMDELDKVIKSILKDLPAERILCSSDITDLMGRYLLENGCGEGFLQMAHKKNVPIFIPAFTDSEIGFDFVLFNRYRKRKNLPEIHFDPFLDFERYYNFIINSKILGIITLGGGVPRNWAQQICPYIDIKNRREKIDIIEPKRFKYGIRICGDSPHWGGLSGSTYSEAVSWGKFVPPDEGGTFAEVHCDFTIAFPILIKALFDRLDNSPA